MSQTQPVHKLCDWFPMVPSNHSQSDLRPAILHRCQVYRKRVIKGEIMPGRPWQRGVEGFFFFIAWGFDGFGHHRPATKLVEFHRPWQLLKKWSSNGPFFQPIVISGITGIAPSPNAAQMLKPISKSLPCVRIGREESYRKPANCWGKHMTCWFLQFHVTNPMDISWSQPWSSQPSLIASDIPQISTTRQQVLAGIDKFLAHDYYSFFNNVFFSHHWSCVWDADTAY